MSKVFSEAFREPGVPTPSQFEVLQTIAVLTGELGYPPPLIAVADAHKVKRQAIGQAVQRLRVKGLVEEQPYVGCKQGLLLSHNGKLALETALGAGLKD